MYFTMSLLSPLRKQRDSSFEQTWIYLTKECFVPSLIDWTWPMHDDGQQSNFDQKNFMKLSLRLRKIIIFIQTTDGNKVYVKFSSNVHAHKKLFIFILNRLTLTVYCYVTVDVEHLQYSSVWPQKVEISTKRSTGHLLCK